MINVICISNSFTSKTYRFFNRGCSVFEQRLALYIRISPAVRSINSYGVIAIFI